MRTRFRSTFRLNPEEVTKQLEYWAADHNLDNYFIQITHYGQGEYVIFYDARLDEEIY